MGKWIERVVANRVSQERKYGDIPKYNTDNADIVAAPDELLGVGIDFVSLLTDAERRRYFKLLKILQSPKFGMDRETAQREARKMIARKRSPLQERQAAEDYRRYGYVKIFSTVLEQAIYLVRDQTAYRRVPDKNIPVFLEADLGAVKGLCPGTAKLLLEIRLIFGGPIKVEDYTEPPSQGLIQNNNGRL